MKKYIAVLSLVVFPLAAQAQTLDGGRVTDSSAIRSRAAADSSGHNWFASLLRKIARRSDDPVADSVSAADSSSGGPGEVVGTPAPTSLMSFKSRKDSVGWENAKTVAEKSEGFRIVVDIFAKQLHVIDGNDTLRSAPVATAKNESVKFNGHTYTFVTPRGVRTVLRKEKEPKWTPPEWHFAEVALEHDLKVQELVRGKVVRLKNGDKLVTQGDEVGLIREGSKEFEPMALDEHIVFGNVLYIPPTGTKNRVIEGELGHYRLDMGDAYYLHGTPYAKSIGAAVTHGCVRLHDEDIEWLYENVPVGTKVYLY